VRAQLIAQRGSNGWVVTYHVIKLPCGSIDVYYLLSQNGWRSGKISLSVCNREVSGYIRMKRGSNVVQYEVEIDGDFEGANVEQRVKMVDDVTLSS